MTLNELKTDVAQLGFERSVEDEDCFIASANRALSIIYVDRPVSKSAVIFFRGPRISMAKEFIEHRSGETVTIPFTGKAISFRTSGNGSCVIRDSTGASSIPLSGEGQLVRQFVYGDASVTFYGDCYFTVSNLAVFDDVLSDKITDIPEYSPIREIDPQDYCDDFRAFCTQPRDKNGNVISSLQLADGRILAPYDYRGELYLTYYRKPREIDKSRPHELIDISGECSPMLPLLTAAFMWLDDDAGKAQYYMSLYRDLVANTKRYSNNKIDTVYRVNGWA